MNIVFWVLLALLAGYLIFLVAPAVLSYPLIFRRQKAPSLREMDLHGTYYEPHEEMIRRCIRFLDTLPRQEVHTVSHDGHSLYGEFYHGGFDRTVIFFHGYRTCSLNNFFCQSKDFFQKGYNVLLIHQRGHGKSGSKHTTMGILEAHDVVCWVDWLHETCPGQSVVLYGASMGATSVAYASRLLAEGTVQAMVLDCGYLSAYVQLAHECHVRHLPWPLLLPVVSLLARVFLKINMHDSAAEALAHTSLPALFLYGEADKTVPFNQIRQCFDSCASEKQLITVPGGAHTMAYPTGGSRVYEGVFSFLNTHINPKVKTEV